MKKTLFGICGFLGVLCNVAMAGGYSGGGNAVAARFVKEAVYLSENLSEVSSLPAWVTIEQLISAVQNIKVFGVDFVESSPSETGVYLHARNYPSEGKILIDWRAVKELPKDLLWQLVFHEYLGILGIEKDGEYSKSAELVGIVDGSGSPLELATVGQPYNSCRGSRSDGSVYLGIAVKANDMDCAPLAATAMNAENLCKSFGYKRAVNWHLGRIVGMNGTYVANRINVQGIVVEDGEIEKNGSRLILGPVTCAKN